jgi:hypothetical protein
MLIENTILVESALICFELQQFDRRQIIHVLLSLEMMESFQFILHLNGKQEYNEIPSNYDDDLESFQIH